MKSLSVLRLAIGIVAVAATAHATCTWEWDCSQGYPCRQVPICDNALDLPGVEPPGISPIPPPTIRPIPQPTIPPLGTQSCQPQYLCDAMGRCSWQTVCE